jgi:hypothetical protein
MASYGYFLHVLDELPRRATRADINDLLPFNYAKQHSAVTA